MTSIVKYSFIKLGNRIYFPAWNKVLKHIFYCKSSENLPPLTQDVFWEKDLWISTRFHINKHTDTLQELKFPLTLLKDYLSDKFVRDGSQNLWLVSFSGDSMGSQRLLGNSFAVGGFGSSLFGGLFQQFVVLDTSEEIGSASTVLDVFNSNGDTFADNSSPYLKKRKNR